MGIDIGQLKINLSQVQCVQPNLAERIFVIARRYGLVPGELCFEITETSAGISPEIMRRNMDSLVSAGFSLAIDDFGTGHSNMAMLLELQFSVIKLDRVDRDGRLRHSASESGHSRRSYPCSPPYPANSSRKESRPSLTVG
jgi:EAL domain-containing protein (putative c-di-GMP-specific phosphodiesterase class I)